VEKFLDLLVSEDNIGAIRVAILREVHYKVPQAWEPGIYEIHEFNTYSKRERERAKEEKDSDFDNTNAALLFREGGIQFGSVFQGAISSVCQLAGGEAANGGAREE